MNTNNINQPNILKEYFVDSFQENIDNDTLKEYEAILDKIKNLYPIYDNVQEEIKENIYEEKINNSTFLIIKTEKHIQFTDFDGKVHKVVEKMPDQKYNLDGLKPTISEIKREQSENPRGILCWSNQYKTYYYLIKIYNIGGNEVRLKSEIEYNYEAKDHPLLIGEIPGENRKKQLEEEYKIIDIQFNEKFK